MEALGSLASTAGNAKFHGRVLPSGGPAVPGQRLRELMPPDKRPEEADTIDTVRAIYERRPEQRELNFTEVLTQLSSATVARARSSVTSASVI